MNPPKARFVPIAVRLSVSSVGITIQRLILAAMVIAVPAALCMTAYCQQPEAATFPAAGLLPKDEIGVSHFLREHPSFDGRGVTVAIFDTGVDPGAPGLQLTSEGKIKIVDMIDATGSGDVPMRQVRRPNSAGRISGLSGRSLQLPQAWIEMTQQFRVGLKAGYQLFPPDLEPRMRAERRKEFMLQQAQLENKLRAELAEWDRRHAAPDEQQKQRRAELQTRLDQLVKLASSYEDPGPVYDCVTFHDGSVWRAAVDTNEDGSFADEKALASYELEHQFATFRGGAALNFALKIYDDGKLLSLVTDCGPHGTHVAGIVAGNFADEPELNGIAPGAQLVAIKIADPRLQQMETETGMTRAITAAINSKCDLINMSFGEPSRTPDEGLIAQMLNRAVYEHGIIFVSSAGNAGPALSTVGAPGGTLSAAIGVGAYVPTQLAAAAYALREPTADVPYTWTSRGPTFDGAAAISVLAPGGAFAPVPNWTQQSTMRMNGTSMASPSVCGSIALLVSGMKQLALEYSPHSIRRALENTSRPVADVEALTQGAGVLQVPAAFEYLKQYGQQSLQQTGLQVTVQGNDRGVYLRQLHEVRTVHDFSVRVKPRLPEAASNSQRLHIQVRCSLQTTAPWIQCGDHLVVTHAGDTFQLRVDPTGLSPGLHFAEVRGFYDAAPQAGPLFRVPVTVIVPRTSEDWQVSQQLALQPGQVERIFVSVPGGANWAELTLQRDGTEPAHRYMLQAVERHEGLTFRDTHTEGTVNVGAGQVHTRSFAVTAGKTLELAIGQYWSSLGNSQLHVTLRFQQLELAPDPLIIAHGDGPLRVAVRNGPQRRNLAPQANLTIWRRTLQPTKAEQNVSMDPRDLLPDGRRMQQLILTYELEQYGGSSVTLRLPRSDGWLYDSPFAGHLWLLFDPLGRHIATDDVFANSGTITIGKGKHTLRVRLRHPDAAALKPFSNMALHIDTTLPKAVTLNVASSHWDASKSFRGALEPFEQTAAYVHPPDDDKLPKGIQAGDQLLGSVTVGAAQSLRDIAGGPPGGHTLRWLATFGDKTPSATAPDADKKSDKPENDQSTDDAQQRFARLHEIDTPDKREEHLQEIVEIIDLLLADIDDDAIANQLGLRPNPYDPATQQAHQRAEKHRDQLADLLYRKGRALGYMELPEVRAKHPIADPAAFEQKFEETFNQLARFVDVTSRQYFLLTVRRERRRGNLGEALKLLQQHVADGPPDERYFSKRREVFKQLGWDHWYQWATAWTGIRYGTAAVEF